MQLRHADFPRPRPRKRSLVTMHSNKIAPCDTLVARSGWTVWCRASTDVPERRLLVAVLMDASGACKPAGKPRTEWSAGSAEARQLRASRFNHYATALAWKRRHLAGACCDPWAPTASCGVVFGYQRNRGAVCASRKPRAGTDRSGSRSQSTPSARKARRSPPEVGYVLRGREVWNLMVAAKTSKELATTLRVSLRTGKGVSVRVAPGPLSGRRTTRVTSRA
jgi:hypothetical protein